MSATLVGHANGISAVAFADASTLLSAVGGQDQTVRIWDLRTGRERTVYRGLTPPLALAPGGRGFAAVKAGVIQLVNLPGVPELSTSRNLADGVDLLAFSADGKTLASAGPDRIVRLWDPATGKEQGSLEVQPQPITSLAFSPDGTLLAQGGSALADKKPVGRIVVWELAGRKQRLLLTPPAPVLALAISPDGKRLASAGRDGTVALWDLAGGKEPIRQLPTGVPWLGTGRLAFTPDGRVLVAASSPPTGRFNNLWSWDLTRDPPFAGEPRSPLEKPAGWGPSADCLTISPDGRYLLAASASGHGVWRWDLASGKVVPWGAPSSSARKGFGSAFDQSLRGAGTVHAVAISPDCRTLALGLADRTVQLWDLDTGQQRAVLAGHLREVSALAFSADGKLLASGSHNRAGYSWIKGGEIKVWSSVADPLPHSAPLTSLALSADASSVVTADMQGKVLVWDGAGKLRFGLDGHVTAASVACSGDGRTLATKGEDGLLHLWDARTGTHRDTLPALTISSAVRPTADGHGFYAVGNPLRIWAADPGQPAGARLVIEVPLPTRYQSVALSHDRSLLAGVSGLKLELIEVKSRKVRWSTLEGGAKMSLLFAPAGDLIVGHADGSIRILDPATGKERDRLTGPVAAPLLLEISADGRTLASATSRRTQGKLEWEVWTWDLQTRKPKRPAHPVTADGIALRFTPDGRLWVAAHQQGAVLPVKEIP